MPKYYEGHRKLPYTKVMLLIGDVTKSKIERHLKNNAGEASLCVRFEGFEGDCLGYVFNVKRTSDGHEICDITKKKLLCVRQIEKLVDMIHHVSGARYDENWQKTFQQMRNQISSDK